PSGGCAAIVLPTAALLSSLPVSVLVAMVVMRASVIVICRAVDAIQIRQGLLKKRVQPAENWGVLFALLAMGTSVLMVPLTAALEARGLPAKQWLGISAADSCGSFGLLH